MSKLFKELTNHTILYMIGSVAGMACSIFLLPIFTRYLSRDNYGLLEITDTLFTFMMILLMNGLSQAIAKLFNDAGSKEQQRDVFGTIFWFASVMGVVGGIVMYAFKDQIAVLILGDAKYVTELTISIGILTVSPACSIGTYYLNLNKKPLRFIVISLIKLVLNVSLNLFFIVGLRLGAKGMLLGEFFSTSILLIYMVIYIKKTYGLPFIKKDILVRAIKFGLPFLPALLGATIMHRADRYFIQKYCGLSDMGIYSIGFRFPFMLSSILIGSFGQIWNTTGLYDLAKLENGAKIQARLATYVFTIILICEMALAFMGPTILKILTSPEYSEAYKVLQIASVSLIIYSLHQFFYTGALLKNKTWLLPISFVSAAVASVVFNILLLPKFGYIAAAWVSVISYSIFCLTLYLLCNKHHPIPYEFKRMGFLFTGSILLLYLNNQVRFDNAVYDAGKQFLFYSVIPIYALFGPFLRNEEIVEFGSQLSRVNPLIGGLYLKIAMVVRKSGEKSEAQITP